jgi:GNAT superfamily N-acetyltransferase
MLLRVQIRARHPSDVDACLQMAHHVKRLDGYPPRGPVDERFMAPPQELAAWVAEIDATVVGHVALHSTGASDTVVMAAHHTGRTPEELAVVARVLVSPAARRRGVARALLGTAVESAHERGRQPILDVAEHLSAAIRLYETSGWERAGEVIIPCGDEPSLPCYVYIGPDGPARRDVTRP